MSVLDKLTFWKKKDDFSDLGKDLGLDKELGLGGDTGTGMSPDLGLGFEGEPSKYPSMQSPMGAPVQPSFPQPHAESPGVVQPAAADQDFINSKSLEVISSKLDALWASMESINQRLANLETMARGEQEDQGRKRYF